MSLGDAQHGLFHRLVREGLDGVELSEFLRDVGEFGRGGVVDKVLAKIVMAIDKPLIPRALPSSPATQDSRCRTT
jgi:hypothetical protein